MAVLPRLEVLTLVDLGSRWCAENDPERVEDLGDALGQLRELKTLRLEIDSMTGRSDAAGVARALNAPPGLQRVELVASISSEEDGARVFRELAGVVRDVRNLRVLNIIDDRISYWDTEIARAYTMMLGEILSKEKLEELRLDTFIATIEGNVTPKLAGMLTADTSIATLDIRKNTAWRHIAPALVNMGSLKCLRFRAPYPSVRELLASLSQSGSIEELEIWDIVEESSAELADGLSMFENLKRVKLHSRARRIAEQAVARLSKELPNISFTVEHV